MNKRIVTLIGIALMSITVCMAQTVRADSSTSKRFFNEYRELSVSVGIGNSYLILDDDQESGDVTSITAKVSVDRWFHRSWALSYGIQYTREGMPGFIVEGNKHLEAKDRFHYIGLPVIAKWKVTKEKGLVIGAGVRPDFMVRATETYLDFDNEYSRTVSNDYKKFDIKIVFDFSYTFKNGMRFGLEKEEGLCDVSRGSTRFITDIRNSRSSCTYFYVGYCF